MKILFIPFLQVTLCLVSLLSIDGATDSGRNALARTAEPATTLTRAQKRKFIKNSELFTVDIYGRIKEKTPNENIIFSPFSIQACLALASVGAEGETAAELDRGALLISSDVDIIAESFANILAEFAGKKYIKIASHIYVMRDRHLRRDFMTIANKKFYAGAASMDFERSNEAAARINNWVSSQTNGLIKELVSPKSLSKDTHLLLLNAIYFKGEWLNQFDKAKTQPELFYLDPERLIRVPMMHVTAEFPYIELPELGATALEMPYKDSDLSMLIILPNSSAGLGSLQYKLATMTKSLTDIANRMRSQRIAVSFPKFKFETSVDLKDPLKQLGMRRMFTSSAEFGNMLEGKLPIEVTSVLHKAVIDVNEEGTEAAAVTGVFFGSRGISFQKKLKTFVVDRPFFYVIRNEAGLILFAGHVVNPLAA